MRYIQQSCRVSSPCLGGSAVVANVRLQVEGLSGQLEKNACVQLSTTESDEVMPDRRLRACVNDIIREGLKVLGYYQSTIELSLRPPLKKGRQVLIAKVTPGVPVLIGGTDVVLRDGARTDKGYLKLLGTRPAIGMVLNQGDYKNFKKFLTSIALRKSYFDNELTKAQLGIALGLHKAFWDIDYNSGEHYRSGYMTFEGSQIHDEYPRNLVPSREGDEYESKDLTGLNRRFSATGWLNSVVVAP